MDTVIVFWQDEHLNEEAEWVFTQGGEHIHVLRLKQEMNAAIDPRELVEEISLRINAKENWRLFLIDNYKYQCIYFEKDSRACCCCCCSGRCNVPMCGRGRNPFAEQGEKTNSVYKKHREDLISVLNAILNVRSEKFVRPQNAFVIAVRDGDFQCKHELDSTNTKKDYWKIADDFPIYCRYMSYDLHYINKVACRREIFWLYCVIVQLACSKLSMGQLMPRFAYVVRVEYSRDKYYVYLREKIKQLEEKTRYLKVLEHQYEKSQAPREESIIKYPLMLRNKSISVKKVSRWKMRDEEWIDFRNELMQQLQKIQEPPDNYAEAWESLREIVNKEDSENGAIYKEDRDKYEKDILDMRYHSDEVEIEWRNQRRNIGDEVNDLRKVCEGYEKAREYRMGKMQCFLYGGVLLILTMLFYCIISNYDFGDNNFKENIIFLLIIIASLVLTFLVYQIRYVWINYFMNRIEINNIIERIRAYQRQMDEDRLSFLNKTRNTMLYWKREHNLERNERRREEKRQEVKSEINEINRLKNKINMLYGYEKETTKNIKISDVTPKRQYIQIGSENAETEFIFIQKIKFFMREQQEAVYIR